MKTTIRVLLAMAGPLGWGAAAAQIPAECEGLQLERAVVAQATPRLTLERLAGQASASSPEMPQISGPVANLCLALFSESTLQRVAVSATDGAGSFALDALPPGDYVLMAAKPGSPLGSVRVPVRISGEAASRSIHRGVQLQLTADSRAQSGRAQIIENLQLRQKLLEMVKVDQEIRMEVLASSSFANMDPRLVERMKQTDERTHTQLLTIIREHGWPDRDLVGVDGTSAASTMIQHVPPETGKQVLPLVEAAFRAGKVTGENYAMLVDHARIADGLPQLYGTDFKFSADGEELDLQPTERDAEIDARRREIGLVPLAEYREMIRQIYSAQRKQRRAAPTQAAESEPASSGGEREKP